MRPSITGLEANVDRRRRRAPRRMGVQIRSFGETISQGL
jgi:hypothetical protein